MKLGAYLGYWGVGMGTSPRDLLSTVQEAETLGYDSVWTAEAYGSDAASVLAFLAAGTDTIKLGSRSSRCPPGAPR
jgi:alkanesulfonate monooxygenase SsuD/methylene tetrahydromethanopterin reductase-like flavin-dependent oxidoreductase (luciferase family)